MNDNKLDTELSIDEKIREIPNTFDFYHWNEEQLKEIEKKIDELLDYLKEQRGWKK